MRWIPRQVSFPDIDEMETEIGLGTQKVGDLIEAIETKPISKTKRFNLVKVLQEGAE